VTISLAIGTLGQASLFYGHDLRVMSPTSSISRSPAKIVTYRFGRSLETQFMINMFTMVTMMITFLVPN